MEKPFRYTQIITAPHHQYMVKCQEKAIENIYRMIRLFEMQISREDPNLSDLDQNKLYLQKLYDAIGLIAIPNGLTDTIQDEILEKIYRNRENNKQLTELKK